MSAKHLTPVSVEKTGTANQEKEGGVQKPAQIRRSGAGANGGGCRGNNALSWQKEHCRRPTTMRGQSGECAYKEDHAARGENPGAGKGWKTSAVKLV